MALRGMFPVALAVALMSGCGGKKDGPEYLGSTQMISDKGLLFALGDTKPYNGPIIDYHPNGVKSYQVEVKDGVAQGAATEWYKNGQKMTETTLENGQATGMIKGWYSSGKKEYEMPIKNGEIDGVGIEYFETGTRKSETAYVNGSRNGRERGYSEAGHKLWEAYWRDDKLHGKYIKFSASGKTNNITQYANGLKKGTSRPTVKVTKKPKPEPTKPEPKPPNRGALGRITIWTTTQITTIYTGKTTAILETAFGPPDAKIGDTWVYTNMKINIPGTRRRYTTVNFLIADGMVLLVQVN